MFVFVMMFLLVKMKLNVDDECVVEWLLFLGNVVIWGAAAFRATRVEIGSFYILLFWLILLLFIIIVLVFVLWIFVYG